MCNTISKHTFCGIWKPLRYLVSSLAVLQKYTSFPYLPVPYGSHMPVPAPQSAPDTLLCLRQHPPSMFRQGNWNRAVQTKHKLCVILFRLPLQRLDLSVLQSHVIFLILPSSPLMPWWDEVRPFKRKAKRGLIIQTERNNLAIQAT